MTELLIGCPIQKREWIIDKWFNACEASAETIPHEYVFVLDTNEQPLNEKIDAWDRFLKIHKVHVDEVPREDKRTWNQDRFHRMVYLRNELLNRVRQIAPKYFLSLDSDILLHKTTIPLLMQRCDQYDAVGGKAYMTVRGFNHPSYANLGKKKENLIRPDRHDLIAVDVIMAIKMMTPAAYNIDYQFHEKGEDIGWSKAAKGEGLTLGWEGSVANLHVMTPSALDKPDPRC